MKKADSCVDLSFTCLPFLLLFFTVQVLFTNSGRLFVTIRDWEDTAQTLFFHDFIIVFRGRNYKNYRA